MDLKFLQELGTPISAKEIRDLKRKEDEINRLNALKLLLKNIYSDLVKKAKTSYVSRYEHIVNSSFYNNEKFIQDNRNEIIIGLQHMFRDCNIQMRTFSNGGNGEMCDITDLPEDTKKCFSEKNNQTRIIIDWSK